MGNTVTRKWRKHASKGSVYKNTFTGNYYMVASAGDDAFVLVNLNTGNTRAVAGPISSIFRGMRGLFKRQHKGAKFEIVVG